MQAITTKYHGPTNLHGARIFARCMSGSAFVPYHHELDAADNHALAAAALVKKMGGMWPGKWAMGETKTGFVFVALGSGDVFTLPPPEPKWPHRKTFTIKDRCNVKDGAK